VAVVVVVTGRVFVVLVVAVGVAGVVGMVVGVGGMATVGLQSGLGWKGKMWMGGERAQRWATKS
jgi:hypothetical protein